MADNGSLPNFGRAHPINDAQALPTAQHARRLQERPSLLTRKSPGPAQRPLTE